MYVYILRCIVERINFLTAFIAFSSELFSYRELRILTANGIFKKYSPGKPKDLQTWGPIKYKIKKGIEVINIKLKLWYEYIHSRRELLIAKHITLLKAKRKVLAGHSLRYKHSSGADFFSKVYLWTLCPLWCEMTYRTAFHSFHCEDLPQLNRCYCWEALMDTEPTFSVIRFHYLTSIVAPPGSIINNSFSLRWCILNSWKFVCYPLKSLSENFTCSVHQILNSFIDEQYIEFL